MSDDLSKYGTFCVLCAEVPLRPQVPVGMADASTTSNSTILSQLVAGSIIVRHIKSISVPSFPLRLHGPMRSTYRAFQGFLITSFVGTLTLLVFMPFVDLAFMTVFDKRVDGIVHTFL